MRGSEGNNLRQIPLARQQLRVLAIGVLFGCFLGPLLPFFGGGFPYHNRLRQKVATLILTSLLEDLALRMGFDSWFTWCFFFLIYQGKH